MSPFRLEYKAPLDLVTSHKSVSEGTPPILYRDESARNGILVFVDEQYILQITLKEGSGSTLVSPAPDEVTRIDFVDKQRFFLDKENPLRKKHRLQSILFEAPRKKRK